MIDDTDLDAEEAFSGAEPKSSRAVLAALSKAEDAFRDWQATCETIDRIYNLDGSGYGALDLTTFEWRDAELDLFWSSFEVLKPAVYARPPVPVVVPLFKDGKQLYDTTAELLERCAVSTLKRTSIGDVMIHLRDDLLFAGRGAPWVRYEVEKGKKSVCIEHKDRRDFLHEPARKWEEVGWVAGAAWLTRKEMRARFRKTSGDAYTRAKYSIHRQDDQGGDVENRATTRKCKVWEVWHRADGRVYWVTEGVEVLLDESAPEIELSGFFPCPRPAYATCKRRSLIPVPDWERYAVHFQKISELTRRIYSLLDAVKMKGLVAGGGDVADAIEQLLRDESSDQIIVPVPGAALLANGGKMVEYMPLTEIATAITGLIEARTQLIADFYQLSGISDIMRGATEAEETLGAQELKSQYGSVRVREKSAELQRVAADAVKIVSEVLAEKFSENDLIEMSQMDLLKRSAIEKRIKDIESAARKEIEALGKRAQQEAQKARESDQQVDPQQAEQMFAQAQQQIVAKYAPMLAEAQGRVPIEDVMKLLRDDRTRGFVFEIESSSTILTDELQEKRSRNEFLEAFARAQQAVMGLIAMGEEGAKLAGAMMKFVLAPYRAGRDLEGAIDAFIEKAPEMARMAAGQQGESEELAQAQKMLAEAEMEKARAAMANVEAKAALDKAEMQRKLMEMQQRANEANAKAAGEAEKLRQSLAQAQGQLAEQDAKINLMEAQTAQILAKIGLDVRKQDLEEYRAANEQQNRAVEQARGVEQDAIANERADRGEDRADRQQDFSERTAMNGDGR